eukprot:13629520-Heterocapsa_arctica.AAC.1
MAPNGAATIAANQDLVGASNVADLASFHELVGINELTSWARTRMRVDAREQVDRRQDHSPRIHREPGNDGWERDGPA